jgi:hypothetical protein
MICATGIGANMPHPKNKQDRKRIGIKKGLKRATGLSANTPNPVWFSETAKRLRDTTTICSCPMCGNPRNSKWSDEPLTLQELKDKDKTNTELNDIE